MSNFFIEEVTKEVKNSWGEPTGRTETQRFLRTGRVIFCSVIAVVLALLLIFSNTFVAAGHTGVVSSFGRVETKVLDEGHSFKAPWKRVIKIDNRIQKETFELKCFTADTQETTISYALNHHVNKNKASELYKNIGKKYSEIIISPAVSEIVKNTIGKYTADNLIEKRHEISQIIKKELAECLISYNIIVSGGSIEDIDFTDTYTDSVEKKQVALQKKLQATIESEQKVIEAKADANIAREKAQGEADALKTKADAEAEANKKIADSLTDRVLKNKFYETWNGELPIVSGDGGAVVIPSDMIPSAE